MRAIDKAIYQLRIDEGFRALAYRDSKHLLTIGYGRCLDTNPLTDKEVAYLGHDGRDRPITQVQAEILLRADVEDTQAKLQAVLPWISSLDDTRHAALINLAFNLGVRGLMGFKKTLTLLKGGKYPEAAEEVLNSQWRKDVGANRSMRISNALRFGDSNV